MHPEKWIGVHSELRMLSFGRCMRRYYSTLTAFIREKERQGYDLSTLYAKDPFLKKLNGGAGQVA